MSESACSRVIADTDTRNTRVCGHSAAEHGLVIGEAGDFRACRECWCPDYLPPPGSDYYADAGPDAEQADEEIVVDADTRWVFEGPVMVEASGGALHVRYVVPPVDFADLIAKAHDPAYSDEWVGNAFRARVGRTSE